MPITIPHYDLVVADPGIDLETALETGQYTEYKHVAILHTDQVVAEQAGARYGLGELRKSPLAYTSLWAWCALRRRGEDLDEFPVWKQRVAHLEQDPAEVDQGRGADQGLVGEPVDPTIPADE